MQKYDFENSIGFIVNRTAKAFVKALDSELREKVGITFGQWKVIVTLVDQDGLTQKEIADKLGLEGPTLIPIIDKMEKEMLVVRKVDAGDRRNNRVYRTEKADALWDKTLECALKIKQISIRNIPEQNINIMRNVLEKVWQNLRIEFDVVGYGCASEDNTVTMNSTTKARASGNVTTTAATTTATALTSTRRRKSRNYYQEKGS